MTSNASISPSSARAFTACLLLAAIVVIADQVSKGWVIANIDLHQRIDITAFFGLIQAHNYGAAFSFLNFEGGNQVYFFGLIAVVTSIVLLVWLWQIAHKERQLAVALTLILGGAVGNLIDRIVHQYVIDFLWVHYGSWQFPAFNIADSAITIGAILLIMDSIGWRWIRYPHEKDVA